MPKTKISEFSATPANNTDIDSINIAEGCAPSGINDAIRELMAQLKDFQTGAVGDSFNGPVGTTTAAAGAFTTLSSTGNTTLGDASGDSVTINGTATFANANPTLSAGTANGVAYLNGSKVVTSGSALTFNGTNFDCTGSIGAGTQLVVSGPQSTDGNIRISNTTTRASGNKYGIRFAENNFETNASIYAQQNSSGNNSADLVFGVNAGTGGIQLTSAPEGMRLTSTGLGIGTSTVGARLTTQASANSYVAGALQINSLSGTYKSYITNVGGLLLFSNSSTVDQLILDSSGNLGLGVTPSAWQSGAKAQQIGATYSLALSAFGDDSSITTNAFYNNSGNWVYQNTASSYKPTRYNQYLGNHIWSVAASTGTAGSTITWSESARIDTSGNLLLGTTTAGAKFTLEYVGTSAVGQNINDSANTTNSTLMQFLIQGTQVGTIKRVGATSAVIYNTTSDYRLKTVTGDVTGQGERIDALKPVDYQWKEGGQQARGFLAHEFQTVYPSSVSGDKDAVDADGNPEYQAMQAGSAEVIADLVAEIQSLRKRLADAGL